MIKRKWYYVAVAVQLAVLLGLTASYYAIDLFGREVVLKTAPVDPRDLFYGDYVQLHYEIQNLSDDLWKSDVPLAEYERHQVYVVLEPCDDVYCATGVYDKKPDISDNQIALKGSFQYYDEYLKTINLDYGIERYYVEENKGKEIEQKTANAKAVIMIAPWGQMKISELQFD